MVIKLLLSTNTLWFICNNFSGICSWNLILVLVDSINSNGGYRRANNWMKETFQKSKCLSTFKSTHTSLWLWLCVSVPQIETSQAHLTPFKYCWVLKCIVSRCVNLVLCKMSHVCILSLSNPRGSPWMCSPLARKKPDCFIFNLKRSCFEPTWILVKCFSIKRMGYWCHWRA